MPARDPRVRRASSSLAATVRWHPDADTTEARRNLEAAKLEQHIRDAVAKSPPLTEAQRAELALILTGGSDVA
jgi:hypothetical protein